MCAMIILHQNITKKPKVILIKGKNAMEWETDS